MDNEIPIDISADDLKQDEQRSLIFQILYALESHNYDINLENLVECFANNFGILINIESDIFKKLSRIAAAKDDLDLKILPLISKNWRPERLGTVTKLILKIGAWELLNTNLDSAIVINESIELAKCFAEKDAYKFINGVLDEFADKYKQKN